MMALCEGNPMGEGPVEQNFNASFIVSLKKLIYHVVPGLQCIFHSMATIS